MQDSKVDACLILSGSAKEYSKGVVPFSNPFNNIRIQLYTCSPNFDVFSIFRFSHSNLNGYIAIFHYGFNLQSLVTDNMQIFLDNWLFLHLFCKVSTQVSCPFKNLVVFIFEIDLNELIYSR